MGKKYSSDCQHVQAFGLSPAGSQSERGCLQFCLFFFFSRTADSRSGLWLLRKQFPHFFAAVPPYVACPINGSGPFVAYMQLVPFVRGGVFAHKIAKQVTLSRARSFLFCGFEGLVSQEH